MKPKTLAEAIKNEKLRVLSDKKRAELVGQLEALEDKVREINLTLQRDERNRMRIQWLSRGWMARD